MTRFFAAITRSLDFQFTSVVASVWFFLAGRFEERFYCGGGVGYKESMQHLIRPQLVIPCLIALLYAGVAMAQAPATGPNAVTTDPNAVTRDAAPPSDAVPNAALPSDAGVQVDAASPVGVVRVGHARFTVVTDGCIRIEYSPDDQFIDDTSLFAINRGVRSKAFKAEEADGTTVITTARLQLRYHPDGKAFSADNLSAQIRTGRDGKVASTWTPGRVDTQNLGGTARTLDGWTGARELEPGLLSRAGWHLIDDSTTPLFTQTWVRGRPKDAGTDWYLFAYGSDYTSALQSLAAISGPVPMPRRYTLGTWYSRYWSYTSDDFKQIVREYAQHDFPLDMFVIDMDWHTEGWTGYTWNRDLIPDPAALLKWLHEQDLHVTLNDHPADGVQPGEATYGQFMTAMGKDPASGKALPFDAGDQTYLRTFYRITHKPIDDIGNDFWWLDWQQYPNTRSIPELTNLWWLNHFYFDRSSDGGKRGQNLSRWAGWGSHRYPIQFSGDASSDWTMLAFEVPFTATAGNVGCFFWSHDIGGHNGARNEESYARWCQFGLTSAALRSHSSRDPTTDRRPWNYPKYVEESIRRSFHLRSELFPYIYTAVHQATAEMIPLNRPMYLMHPDQERAYHSPQEYLFGDDLLAAPVVMPGVGPGHVGWQAVWFPPGDDWFNFFTGQHYAGGTEQLVAADINAFPLFVRANAPLPMRPYTPRMATAPLDTLIVRVYPDFAGKQSPVGSTLYEDDGATTAYTRGQSATTRMQTVVTDGRVELTIAPTEGKYDGQLEKRALRIELAATPPATSVTINGNPAPAEQLSYDAQRRMNVITLPPRSIREQTQVVMVAAPGEATDAKAPAKADWSAAGGSGPATAGADAKSLAAALAALGPDVDPRPLLAAHGIGVLQKNETAYGYPADGVTAFYAPPGLIDAGTLRFVFEGENHAKNAAVDASSPLPADGTNRDKKDRAMAQRPDERGFIPLPTPSLERVPNDPFAEVAGRITFSVADRPVTLATPPVKIDFARFGDNVAPEAKVRASSQTQDSPAAGAIEGQVGGYPQVRAQEWSSDSERDGAWLRLTWETPQTIDRVLLFDRMNADDQVLAGELQFDDGPAVPFGELPNDGMKPQDVKCASRKTKVLTIRLTRVSEATKNIGLAEIVVVPARTSVDAQK